MASPVDDSRTPTNGSTSATPVVLNYPATVSAGDTLIMLLRINNATITTPAGWTALANIFPSEPLTDDATLLAWRKADGTEAGGTISVTVGASGKFAGVIWRITGAADPTSSPPEISTKTQGTDTSPDPATVTPSGGSQDYLFMWAGAWTGEQTSPPTGQPTNYSNPTGADSGTTGATASNCRVAGATRQRTAASEDPPVWTISAADNGWSAWAVAIYPAGSGSSLAQAYWVSTL